MRDEDGYFWYKGWSEDLIKSSGFRIGPAEVEECLIAHPSLAIAVIAKPNAERGSIVKAVVKIRAGVVGDDASLYALESAHSARLGSGPVDFRFAGCFTVRKTSDGHVRSFLADRRPDGAS